MKKSLNRSIACGNKSQIGRIKIRVSGLVHTHAWTTLRAHNQACMHRQDYLHMSFYLETLKTQQTEQGFKTRFLAT